MAVTKLKVNTNLKRLIASGILLTVLGCCTYYKSKHDYKEYRIKRLQGIDVSENQEEYNWDTIDQFFDYIIIRASDGTTKDQRFDEIFSQAVNKDLDIGFYIDNNVWKSSIQDENITEEERLIKFGEAVKAEVDNLLQCINGKNPTWPVYLKLEKENLKEELPEEYVKVLLDTYQEALLSRNLKPGIFASKEDFDYLKSVYNDLPKKYATWIANNTEYYKDGKYRLELSDNHELLENNDDIKMLQAYKFVWNTGAKDSIGLASVNYSKVDYSVKKPKILFGLSVGAAALTFFNGLNYLDDRKEEKEKRQKELEKLRKARSKITDHINNEKKQKGYNNSKKKQRGKIRRKKKK